MLGLIFLAFAEHRFDEIRPEVELKATERRPVSADDFRAHGVLFIPDRARLSSLVELPEEEDLGANVDSAMDAIESTNSGLANVLPRGYQKLEKSVLLELVRLFAPLPRMVSGDAFGLIYEYFLAEFAANEGIGNSVAPGIAELRRRSDRPEVLFSPMRSRPRHVDVTPTLVVRWTAGDSFDGPFTLPDNAWVTSRRETSSRRPHYALVCSCPQPLTFANRGELNFSALRNLVGGTRLGASQVTAVVRRLDQADPTGAAYPVALRAPLVEPYFLRLRKCEVVATTGRTL